MGREEVKLDMSQSRHKKQVSSSYAVPTAIELALLLISVTSCYCVLYGPQVLVTRWITSYALSPIQASSLVYATLIPMSVAPLSYGIFLGVSDTRKVILRALGALALVTASLSYAESYSAILMCRLAQGVILPAILTAVMARLSATGPAYGPRLITYYLCTTVIGGLLGRLVSGYCADLVSLDAVWWLWSSICILVMIGLVSLPVYHVPFNNQVTTRKALVSALTLPNVGVTLLCSALMFGGFASALNLLPLRAEELGITSGGMGESSAVAHRYWGYLAGVVIALTARRIDQLCGGRGRAPALGLVVMALSLIWGTLDLAYTPLSLMVLGLCIGLFITHPLLLAHLTQLSPSERGLMSGLYVSSYYIGGALCSWLAGLYMTSFGWEWTLFTLAFILISASILVWYALKERPASLLR